MAHRGDRDPAGDDAAVASSRRRFGTSARHSRGGRSGSRGRSSCTARSGRACATTRRSSTSICATSRTWSANLIGEVDYTTPEGYLQSELFSFLAPILLIVYTIGAGARAIAGEEEAGSLDLLLSTCRSRRRRVLVRQVHRDARGRRARSSPPSCGSRCWRSGRCSTYASASAGSRRCRSTRSCSGSVFGTLALAIGTGTGRKALAIGVPGGLAARDVHREHPRAVGRLARTVPAALAVLLLLGGRSRS